MGKTQHPNAKLIPVTTMPCPCKCGQNWSITYARSNILGNMVLSVDKACHCRVPEPEIQRLCTAWVKAL